jgi:mutator protein MutT
MSDGERLRGVPVHAGKNSARETVHDPARGLVKQPTIVVAAAVIEREGRFLVTRRQAGVHLEGYWEFPGGKCEKGEAIDTCLARELREELAADIHVGREVFASSHAYPDRTVELHFLSCVLLNTPTPQVGQDMRWVARDDLTSLTFPPADTELIELLSRTDNLEKPPG